MFRLVRTYVSGLWRVREREVRKTVGSLTRAHHLLGLGNPYHMAMTDWLSHAGTRAFWRVSEVVGVTARTVETAVAPGGHDVS